MELFWVILIIAAASLIKGITGFGFALVSLPPLMIWYSPKELIPVLMLCNLFASFIIILQKKNRKLVNAQFRSLIFYGGIFTILGVILLSNVSDKILVIILSVFFILLSLFSLLGIKYSIRLKNIHYKIAGAVLGFLTGSISISGPPFALFLHAANVDKQEFREIFSWFSLITAVIAIAGYATIGLITINTLKMTVTFLPVLYIGSFIGKRLNYKVSSKFFEKLSLLITLVASIFLLVKL